MTKQFGKREEGGFFQQWPEQQRELQVTEVERLYQQGFAGAYQDDDEREKFEQEIVDGGGSLNGAEIAMTSGFAESGTGKLNIPFVWLLHLFPGCLPGPAQQRGDCVSHDQKNANAGTYACEVIAGKPDEVTGNIEGVPEISAQGLKQGAFSTEVYYWFRRHGGDGWSCDAASRVAMREAGLVTRGNHPGIGVDLTSYSGRNAGRYGRTPPSGGVADALDNNLIRTATTLRTPDERRDYIANGYCLSTCGSEGYSKTRDQHGVSSRRGSWAHAMAIIGFDDRPETHQLYGGPLDLIQNSWAKWNSGPREIRDSAKYVPAEHKDHWQRIGLIDPNSGNILIPHGAFWARSRDQNRRRVIAKASVDGFQARSVSLGFEGSV